MNWKYRVGRLNDIRISSYWRHLAIISCQILKRCSGFGHSTVKPVLSLLDEAYKKNCLNPPCTDTDPSCQRQMNNAAFQMMFDELIFSSKIIDEEIISPRINENVALVICLWHDGKIQWLIQCAFDLCCLLSDNTMLESLQQLSRSSSEFREK